MCHHYLHFLITAWKMCGNWASRVNFDAVYLTGKYYRQLLYFAPSLCSLPHCSFSYLSCLGTLCIFNEKNFMIFDESFLLENSVTGADWFSFWIMFLQYLPHKIKSQRAICDRFALLFSVAIVWMYSQILTLSGIYNDKPTNIQISCRTDHSGLLSATPW